MALACPATEGSVRPESAASHNNSKAFFLLSQKHTSSLPEQLLLYFALCLCANCISIQLLEGIRLISYEILSHLHHMVVPRLSHASLLLLNLFIVCSLQFSVSVFSFCFIFFFYSAGDKEKVCLIN